MVKVYNFFVNEFTLCVCVLMCICMLQLISKSLSIFTLLYDVLKNNLFKYCSTKCKCDKKNIFNRK